MTTEISMEYTLKNTLKVCLLKTNKLIKTPHPLRIIQQIAMFLLTHTFLSLMHSGLDDNLNYNTLGTSKPVEGTGAGIYTELHTTSAKKYAIITVISC